jgi:hypothetical protein
MGPLAEFRLLAGDEDGNNERLRWTDDGRNDKSKLVTHDSLKDLCLYELEDVPEVDIHRRVL